jgi:two-component system, chemotaxis family, sensor kinase Cph1
MEESSNGIFITDRLGEIWQPAEAFADVGSGVLAISLMSREPRDFILWFRPEIVETVSWGGDPNKPVEIGPHDDRLTPRKSFEVWQQTVRGRTSPWLPSDGDAALDLRGALLEIVLRRIDVAAREQAKAYEQDRLLMAELDHRVKNILANIQALVTQSSRSAGTLTEFTEGLERRIRSMSKAHSLLAASRWQGVSIHSLVSEELDYIAAGTRISLIGPEVNLTPRAALALSLAIHELATNAVKYGALSASRGRVEVHWELNSAGAIDLSWTEAGGPVVKPPRRRGFGSTLVEQALAMETDGRSVIHFNRDGVRCEIVLPASAVLGIAPPREIPSGGSIEHAPALDKPSEDVRRRILVVEDSALIVMMLEEMLEDIGWEVVGPAMSVATALAIAREDDRLDVALVDVNLNGQMSWDVAATLKERGVPFIFSTGYDASTVVPEQLADAIVLGKPYRLEELARQLRELISDRADKPDS